MMREVELFGIQIDGDGGVAVLLLRESEAPNRVLPIVVGIGEAASIAMAFADEPSPRPSSHDLMTSFIEQVGARLDAVQVTELQDETFLAELTLSGPDGPVQLDSRPSDAIALAVRVDAPVYVAELVLDQAASLEPELDDEEIDREVDRFRALLDEADPADIIEAPEPPADTWHPSEPDGDDAT
jgi:bifunctional DNase/RNase